MNILHKLSHGLLCLLLTAIPSWASDARPAGFEQVVQPFLKQHCLACHGDEQPEGKLSLTKLGIDFTQPAIADRWALALSKILLQQMPPEGQARPEALAAEKVVQFLDQALVAAGHASTLHEVVNHPNYGNYLDHDLLFSGKLTGPAFSPSRIWRRSAYNASVGAFSLPVRIGIRDYAAEGQIDEPTLSSLVAIINGKLSQEFDGTLATRGKNKGKLEGQTKVYVACIQTTPLSAELATQALTHGFQEALQRQPTAAELAHFTHMLHTNAAKGGNKIGLKTTLMAIYLQPEAIFRMELGLGSQLPDGRRLLSPQELYFAISLALADQPLRPGRGDGPDHPHKLLSAGKLATKEDVRRAVEYLLQQNTLDKPRIYRFFHEFFSFQETETIFKDAQTSYQQRSYLMRDGEAFIQSILAQDQQVFEQLLTGHQYPLTVVAGKQTYTWPMLKFSYGLSNEQLKQIEQNYLTGKKTAAKGQPTSRYASWDFAGQRAGMLCHPTWLFAWSTNNENHPVQRGKWILEHLLAGTMPEVPITVQAQVPEDPHRTLRERFVETRQNEYCWNCHRKMNPLGMTFESYDFMGKFRTQEAGKPVDATASFDGTGIPGLDGKGIKVNNAVELMEVLARLPRVRQSIIRHAFRYFMGRNELLSDAPTLIAADQAYQQTNGSFNAVILALLTSDSFLYRK